MVFGWGKKKEEKPQVKTEETITLDELFGILDRIKKDKVSMILDEIKDARKQIANGYSELKNVTKELQKDNLKADDIDKTLQTIVYRGRDQVISVMDKEIPNQIPEFNTQDDVDKIGKDLHQRLKVIGDVLGRQTRVIHIFAKKYADRLKEILEIIRIHTDKITQLSSSLNNLDSKISQIKQLYDDIKKTQNTIKERQSRIEELVSSVSEIEKKSAERTTNRDLLLKSSEFSEYQKILDLIKSHEKNRSTIIDEINQQFTKISRPLGRYSHGTLEKHQQEIFDRLIASPFDVLKKENKDTLIVILDGVRKGVDSGSISVKDTQKSISQINETIEMLDSLIHKVSEFESKHMDLKSKLKVFNSSELDRLEEDLEKFDADKEDLESRIRRFKNEMDDGNEKLPSLYKEIETLLNTISEQKYLLNYG